MRCAHPANFPFLDGPQQFRLQQHRHFTDLIQEQRTLLSLFEQSAFIRPGIRKGPFDVPEQFAFQKLFGNRRTIHRNKRRVFAATIIMNGLGHQLFSRSAFAGNENIRLGVGHATNEIEHLPHGFTFPENLIEGIFPIDLLPQMCNFPAKGRLAESFLNRHQQFIRFDGFRQIIESSPFHRIDGRLYGAERRHHDGVTGGMVLD